MSKDDKYWEQFEEVAPESNSNDDYWNQFDEVKPEVSGIESAFHGATQGLSFGFGDELAGAMDAAGRVVGLKGIGSGNIMDAGLDPEGPTLSWDEIKEAYIRGRDIERAKMDTAREANPTAYTTGEVGGAVASTLVAPQLNAAKGASLLNVTGKAALSGGIAGAGLSEADNVGDLVKDTMTGATIGGVTGGSLSLAGRGLSKAAASKTGQNLIQGAKNLPKNVVSKGGKYLAGIDEEAILRQIERPAQQVAAQADDFSYNLSKKAFQELDDKGALLGSKVGEASDDFLRKLGKTDFSSPAKDLGNKIDDFLVRNKPSKSGFSALKQSEIDELTKISESLKSGDINGEDFFKLREYLDNVKNLAKKYDKEELGPFIRFLKGIRHDADSIVDKSFKQLDDANTSFANFKENQNLLGLKERNAESTIDNLFGNNKTAKQKAAKELFTPETYEAAKDISANKAFANARAPGGDNYFRRGALGVMTFGASEIATNPTMYRTAARGLGRLQQNNFYGMGRFARPLQEAASRGNKALAATHFLLQQQSPEYREAYKKSQEEE